MGCKQRGAAGIVDCTGDFKATGTNAANTKVSEWDSKMTPMGREFQQSVVTKHKAWIAPADVNKFMVLVGVGAIVNAVDTVDMNLVIHGIDYSEVSAARKRTFLRDLSSKVQAAVNQNPAAPAGADHNIGLVASKIRTVFTPTSDSTLSVLVQVPVSDSAIFATQADVTAVASKLESNVNAGVIKNTLQAALRLDANLDPVSTWTRGAILVKSPGDAWVRLEKPPLRS